MSLASILISYTFRIYWSLVSLSFNQCSIVFVERALRGKWLHGVGNATLTSFVRPVLIARYSFLTPHAPALICFQQKKVGSLSGFRQLCVQSFCGCFKSKLQWRVQSYKLCVCIRSITCASYWPQVELRAIEGRPSGADPDLTGLLARRIHE